MQNLSQSATLVANQVSLQDLVCQLDNALFLLNHIGGEEAISSVSFLIDDCREYPASSEAIAAAATDSMRFYSNVLLLKKYIEDAYKYVCKEGGEL